jgi:hypothetical protein
LPLAAVVFEVPAGEGRILFVGYDYADMAPHWIDTLLLAEREMQGDTEVQSLGNATSGVPQQQAACTSNGCNSDKEIRKVFVAGSKPKSFLGTSADIIGKAIEKIKTMPVGPPPPVTSPPPVDEHLTTDEGEEEGIPGGTGEQTEDRVEHEFDHTGDGTQDVDGGFEYVIDGSGYGYGSGSLSHEFAVDGHDYAMDGHDYAMDGHDYAMDGHDYAMDDHDYAIGGHEYGSGPSYEHTTHTSHEYVIDGSGPSYEHTTHKTGYGYGSEPQGLSTKERARRGRLARLSAPKGGGASKGGRSSSWNDDSWASISKWLAKKEKGVLPRGAGVGERGGVETLRSVHKEKLSPQQTKGGVNVDSGGKPGKVKTDAVVDHDEDIESAIRKAMAELAKQRCPPGNNFHQCGPEARKFGPEGEEPPVRAPGFKSAGGQQLAASGAGGGRKGRGWTSLRISDAIRSLSLSNFDLGSAK